MRKIFLACVLGIFALYGAGILNEDNAVSVESEEILPQKAEYKIVQIVINGKVTQATEGAIFGIDDTKIYGNTGCNSYFTDFKRVDSENIEVSTNGGATKMMCDRDSMAFESAFLQNLVGRFSITKSGDKISLTSDKMQVVLEESK
mgnify:FL=1